MVKCKSCCSKELLMYTRIFPKSYVMMAAMIATCLCLFQELQSSPCLSKSLDRHFKNSSHSRKKISELKMQIEEYLSSQWTKERIRRFCLPTTIFLAGQNLVPPTEKKIKGQLYPESVDELGLIEWTAYLDENDEIRNLVLDVRKSGKHQYWLLSSLGRRIGKSFSFPKEIFNEGDFDKELVHRILANAREAYIYAHFFRKKTPSDFRGLGVSKIVKVEHDKAGHVTGFNVLLFNGRVLSADLDTDMKIENILVDGELNRYWTAIINEQSENINKFHSLFD